MAIYHFSAQVISRGKGQSAVASASYRSGERLLDERTGEEKYYRRDVEPDTMILAPSHAPEWVQDRNRLWNEVELAEKRKDAQLAREMNIALPRELSNDQQKELIQDYVQEQFVDKGMVADIAIHRDDVNNPHAHVMLTTRTITADGFGPKNRDWNDRGLLEQWREEWANHANRSLEKEGIQERISHLSHEARGLEQLPTVHLGHVAHEMEKRGVQTDRGNINRERLEYNRLVVDLQKYREEKQALEQKQQKLEKFTTPAERVDLQKASKLLKVESSLPTIKNRYEQLDKWEKRLDNNTNYLQWKDKTIQDASDHFKWIQTFENQVQEAEKRIENINWLNPLKLKENRLIKERAEQDISRAKGEIQFHHEKLDYHREKLGFSNEKEFNQVKNQYEAERPGFLEENKKARQHIRQERDVLQKAENAHKSAFVRQVASLYPEHPEMRYMSYQTAKKVIDVINKYGKGKVVPIEKIEKTVTIRKQEIQRLEGEISRVDQTRGRLQRAENHLQHYEKYKAIVDKYENNPFLKGKMLVSKSAKKEYEDALTARDSYQSYMEKEGISGRKDFEKQVSVLHKMESKIPVHQEQIQSQGKGLGLLDAVIKGIEQANREMNREQDRQQQRTRKSKGKQRYKGMDLER
ncbi:MobQ family relaxase [Sutcliffiella cohnii]|uniref:MobQ family relaxase n=1 Tax=Sutcliffiella cohnii TaxID=33932 RepID=UPI002E2478A8|nr:MobQ family relaxase [Sutcliffiella cohnii]